MFTVPCLCIVGHRSGVMFSNCRNRKSRQPSSSASTSSNETTSTEVLGDIDYEKLCGSSPSEFYAGTSFDPQMGQNIMRSFLNNLFEEEDEEDASESEETPDDDDHDDGVSDGRKQVSFYQDRFNKIFESVSHAEIVKPSIDNLA